ncbi:hypothetical protein F5Y05DRAFT_421157 [Hypoxylon sp. FL0543]|nr:hypothetical protein F5Y05DRAFT_421157 [Hypoxylon sp. FL0543]
MADTQDSDSSPTEAILTPSESSKSPEPTVDDDHDAPPPDEVATKTQKKTKVGKKFDPRSLWQPPPGSVAEILGCIPDPVQIMRAGLIPVDLPIVNFTCYAMVNPPSCLPPTSLPMWSEPDEEDEPVEAPPRGSKSSGVLPPSQHKRLQLTDAEKKRMAVNAYINSPTRPSILPPIFSWRPPSYSETPPGRVGLSAQEAGMACLAPGFETQDPVKREHLQQSMEIREQQQRIIEARQLEARRQQDPAPRSDTTNKKGKAPASESAESVSGESKQSQSTKSSPPNQQTQSHWKKRASRKKQKKKDKEKAAQPPPYQESDPSGTESGPMNASYPDREANSHDTSVGGMHEEAETSQRNETLSTQNGASGTNSTPSGAYRMVGGMESLTLDGKSTHEDTGDALVDDMEAAVLEEDEAGVRKAIAAVQNSIASVEASRDTRLTSARQPALHDKAAQNILDAIEEIGKEAEENQAKATQGVLTKPTQEGRAKATPRDTLDIGDSDSDSDSEVEDGRSAEEAAISEVSEAKRMDAEDKKAQRKEKKKRRRAREWERKQKAEQARQELKEARRKEQEEAQKRRVQRADQVQNVKQVEVINPQQSDSKEEETLAHQLREQSLHEETQKLRDDNERLKNEKEGAKLDDVSTGGGEEIERGSQNEKIQDRPKQIGYGDNERDTHRQTTQDRPKRTEFHDGRGDLGTKQSRRTEQSLPETGEFKQTEQFRGSQAQVQMRMSSDRKGSEGTKPQIKATSETHVAYESRPQHLEKTAKASGSLRRGRNVNSIKHSTSDTVPPPNSQTRPVSLDRIHSPKKLPGVRSPELLVDPEEQARREAMYPVVNQRGSSLPQTPTVAQPLLWLPPDSDPPKKTVRRLLSPSPVENRKRVDKGEDAARAPQASTTQQSGVTNSQEQLPGEQIRKLNNRGASIGGWTSNGNTDLNPEAESWMPMARAKVESSKTIQLPPPQTSNMAGYKGTRHEPGPPRSTRSPFPQEYSAAGDSRTSESHFTPEFAQMTSRGAVRENYPNFPTQSQDMSAGSGT